MTNFLALLLVVSVATADVITIPGDDVTCPNFPGCCEEDCCGPETSYFANHQCATTMLRLLAGTEFTRIPTSEDASLASVARKTVVQQEPCTMPISRVVFPTDQ
jgi:hypothetical protein